MFTFIQLRRVCVVPYINPIIWYQTEVSIEDIDWYMVKSIQLNRWLGSYYPQANTYNVQNSSYVWKESPSSQGNIYSRHAASFFDAAF